MHASYAHGVRGGCDGGGARGGGAEGGRVLVMSWTCEWLVMAPVTLSRRQSVYVPGVASSTLIRFSAVKKPERVGG